MGKWNLKQKVFRNNSHIFEALQMNQTVNLEIMEHELHSLSYRISFFSLK
jgi:hypothetical protein